MHDCCTPGDVCSNTMDHQIPEALMARFEELSALEHEFEDVEEEISKLHFSIHALLSQNSLEIEQLYINVRAI